MSCSSRNAGGRRYIKNCGGIWGKCSGGWRSKRRAQIEEGHLRPDHVHMMIAIPPQYAVSQVIGYIKGKSAIHLARVYGERKRNFVGQHFWARGFWVSTVGRDEAVIREYIRKQEEEDKRVRPDESLAMSSHRKVAQTPRGRVSDPA